MRKNGQSKVKFHRYRVGLRDDVTITSPLRTRALNFGEGIESNQQFIETN
jgi:hypothetical protein